MAEYVWISVYQKDLGYVPFYLWSSRDDAFTGPGGKRPGTLCTDRYRIEERDGTRVLIYDPEPKYEQRDLELVKKLWGQDMTFLTVEQAAELVAKHRQQATQ